MTFEEWWNTKDYTASCKGNCMEAFNAGYETLEAENAKRAEQIEALNKDKDYFSDALDKQIEATYKVVEKLNRAKEVITALLCIPHDMAYEELNSGSWDIVYKAEAFLKEEENA